MKKIIIASLLLISASFCMGYEDGAKKISFENLYDERESRTGFWIIGGGAAVNKLPVSASEYTLPLVFFAYESIQKKAIGDLDFSWSIGFYDLMPEIEAAVTMPLKPFDLRVSAGAYYDFIIGGHGGLLLKFGVIMNKYLGIDVLFIPIGTQPEVSYSESLNQGRIVLNDGEHGLDFPLFGLLLSVRM